MPVDEPQWPDRSWVTSTELAAMAGVNSRTILREIERGNLAGQRAAGFVIEATEAKRWFAVFERWAAQRKVPGTRSAEGS